MCLKAREPPLAKKDYKGNFITSSEGLKNLFEKTYQDRLKHNEIKDDFKDLEKSKIKIFETRIEEASKIKTEPWTMKELTNVLKKIKKMKKPEILMDSLMRFLNLE